MEEEKQDSKQIQQNLQMTEKQNREDQFEIPIHSFIKLRPLTDRYFIKHYHKVTGENGENLNQYVFMHTNRLLLVGFASDHDLVTKSESIKSIKFHRVKDNKIDNMVSGKRKIFQGGGVIVNSKTEIFTATNEKGVSYTLTSTLKGTIIEFNRQLLQNPDLIIQKPEENGYIAVIQTKQLPYQQLDKFERKKYIDFSENQ